MIEEIFKLLKAQLDGFHRKIENNPKDARLQAQHWELIAQHEEIISKIQDLMLNERYSGIKKKVTYNRSKKSIEIQNAICEMMESSGSIATHSEIAQFLKIPVHSIYPFLSYLVDAKRIVRIRTGTYAINSHTRGLIDDDKD